MNNILTFDGDTLISILPVDNRKFVFICLQDKIFYVDTSQEKMFKTDYEMKELGKGHRDCISRRIINKEKPFTTSTHQPRG